VLTLNVQVDADNGRLPGIAWLIRASSANVIGLQEAEKIGPDLARLLGSIIASWDRTPLCSAVLKIERTTSPVHGAAIVLKDGRRVTVFDIPSLTISPISRTQLLSIPYEGGRFIKTETEAVDEARKARGA